MKNNGSLDPGTYCFLMCLVSGSHQCLEAEISLDKTGRQFCSRCRSNLHGEIRMQNKYSQQNPCLQFATTRNKKTRKKLNQTKHNQNKQKNKENKQKKQTHKTKQNKTKQNKTNTNRTKTKQSQQTKPQRNKK